MSDLISRKALLQRIKNSTAEKAVKVLAQVLVNTAPAVDAVEVVRCKDCKHWLKDVAGCTDAVGRCEWANYMVGAVGYCVYGERKENEND